MQQSLALKLLPGGPCLAPAPFQPPMEGLIFQLGHPPRWPVSSDPWYSRPPFIHHTPTLCQALGIQK